MYEVSERFLEALRVSHEVSTRIDVFYNGALVYEDLPVEEGSVTVDEGSQVRRNANLTVADPNLDPSSIIDLLAPFGTEFMVRRGIRYQEGDEETIPLGVFRVDEASRSSWFDGVHIVGSDRAGGLVDARFLAGWNTPGGIEIRDEIYNLVHDVYPNIEFYDLTDDDSPTQPAVWDRERMEAIEKLSAALGAEFIFDPLGRAILRPVTTELADEADWTVNCGDYGVMLDVATGISRSEVYNAVAAFGEQQDGSPPVQGFAFVTNGPLAWGGPFGKKPRFFTSQFITTSGQAQKAAKGILVRSTGFNRSVQPTTIVNPALDAGDTLQIILPDDSEYWHVLRSMTIPLRAADNLPITTRELDENVIDMEGTLA
jgi:hypothetical protein